jgi:hypothetical protein
MRRPTRESEKREKKRKMNLSVVFAKMAMLVLIMLLGYLCARIGITGPEFNQRVTPLVMNVLLTATILNSVLSVPDFTGRDIVDYVLVLTAATVLQIAVAWFLPRLLRTRSEDVGAARLVTAFGNVGFVGLPVVAAIFGDEMVFFASLANIPFNLALYSIGAAQLSGTAGARFDWRKVLNMPVIATLLSVVLLLSRIHVPTVIADTISTLAGATIPLSMLIIDKKDDVVTLRNLGATDRDITRVFMLEGRLITVIGAVAGIAIGLLLCLLQQQFGFVRMGGADGTFIVNAYPVSVHYVDVLIVFVTVIIAGWLAVWYPVRSLSRRLLGND